jgi:hypothetical protein
MLNGEIIQQVDRLPLDDRVALMEHLARSMQNELRVRARRKKGSSLDRVLGALREKGKPAPTDEEVQNMIADYLIEKHS